MADQNRRMSEQFGDLEYEYDLLDHLDPVSYTHLTLPTIYSV